MPLYEDAETLEDLPHYVVDVALIDSILGPRHNLYDVKIHQDRHGYECVNVHFGGGYVWDKTTDLLREYGFVIKNFSDDSWMENASHRMGVDRERPAKIHELDEVDYDHSYIPDHIEEKPAFGPPTNYPDDY